MLAGGLLVVANGLSNLINGLGDWVEDSVHPVKQDRPTVSGAVDPVRILSVAVIGWGAAILVSVLFLPPIFTVLYIVILGFAWMYSYPPRLKARFPANMLAISTPRGALGIAAAWCVLGFFWDPHLWLVLAITVPYVLLANESRNIADREADWLHRCQDNRHNLRRAGQPRDNRPWVRRARHHRREPPIRCISSRTRGCCSPFLWPWSVSTGP